MIETSFSSSGNRILTRRDTDCFNFARSDEIGMLADSFNHLKHQIARTIHALESEAQLEKSLRQQESEAARLRQLIEQSRFAQLQSQINPHFLFNRNISVQAASSRGRNAMDKLTWYDEDGRLYCRRGYEVTLARLASYEATELMPDEIVKMGMMFEDSKRYSGRLELKLNAAAKRMPKWVSVKERLPEDRSNVLVVAYWHERWGVYMGWCAPERAKWSVHIGIGDRDDVAVTYWMPLPEPPKEDDRND